MPDSDTDSEPAVALKKEVGLFSACGIIVGKSKKVSFLLNFTSLYSPSTLSGRTIHEDNKYAYFVSFEYI